MENPLGDMPSLDQNNEPKKEGSSVSEVPGKSSDVEVTEEPKVKKPFFTMGKILAIFGVLLIVGTVVGAIIYSQSSERLQGNLTALNPAGLNPTALNTTLNTGLVPSASTEETSSKDTSSTQTTNLNLTQNTATPSTTDSSMDLGNNLKPTTNLSINVPEVEDEACDSSLNREKNNSSDDVFICVCKDGYVSLNAEDKCIELDYCNLNEKSLIAYTQSRYVQQTTKDKIERDLNGDLAKYQEEHCNDNTLTNVPNLSLNTFPKLTIPEETAVTCDKPLVKQTDSSTGTEYCMCPTQQYPYISISSTGGFTAAPSQQTQCLPFKCDPTQEELNKMSTDIQSILNKQSLSAELISSITAKFSSDYRAWMDKNCQVKEVTCDDLKDDLGAAYFAKDWEKYSATLKQMQEKKCLKPCDSLFYQVAMYLSQNQIDESRRLIDQYIQTCADECNLTYGMMALYAQALSAHTGNLTAAYTVSDEDLARLKELVVKYVENCQCFEIESFLTAPGFPADDYFNHAATAVLNSASTISSHLSTSITVRTAYAQSLDPSVRGVIEDVYNDLCVPAKTTEEPKSCTELTINEPSSTGSYQITEDFDPSSDYLKFTVDNDELITGYKISSQTIVFDEDSENISTNKTEVSLKGGPSAGNEDIITVTALEGGSQDFTHMDLPKETCSAELKITRPPDNPPDNEKEPVCRSLEIISPGDAAEPGTPTIELSSGEYSNKILEIKVDADAGSVQDYKYSSTNGYITFNGQETLYTTDTTVIMEGVIPAGETDTISVWARKAGSLEGIQTCNDGYTVTVPEEEEPPPPEKYTPPPTITEEPPPPPIQEVVVPEPEPTSTPAPVHAAAPEMPSNGPGVLIYLIGAGLGGTLLRKRKK